MIFEIISADQNPTDHILGSNVVGACFMYTRKAYESTGDYDTELFWVEDFDYWQRMIALFKPIPINNVLYDYRWHESSLTSTRKKTYMENVWKKCFQRIGNYMDD